MTPVAVCYTTLDTLPMPKSPRGSSICLSLETNVWLGHENGKELCNEWVRSCLYGTERQCTRHIIHHQTHRLLKAPMATLSHIMDFSSMTLMSCNPMVK